MPSLQLSACLSRTPVTLALAETTPEGIDWTLSYVHPSEMFWRQLKFGDFDISEMSLATLLIQRSRGICDWVALPIFTMRKFFHTALMVRVGSGIHSPDDLRGRRVGVPDYQQTSAVWSRAALLHEFGVKPSELEWFVERPAALSHGGATGFRAPDGVSLSYLEPGETLAAMLARAELDVSFVHLTEANLIDRVGTSGSRQAAVEPLFRDPVAEGQRYYRATGLLPANHCVVVRAALLRRHPWIALNVYACFQRAKAALVSDLLEGLTPYHAIGAVDAATVDAVRRADPLPFGFADQRNVLDALAEYLLEQGLVHGPIDVIEAFAEQTLAL